MAVTFDADAYLATLTPPAVIVGGVTYTGRHLSAVQWMRVLALEDQARKTGSMVAWAACARYVFDCAFPRPWWAVWRRKVSWQLLALPPAVWQGALAAFFAGPPGTTTTPPASASGAAPAPASSSAASSATSSPPTGGAAGTPPESGPPETA